MKWILLPLLWVLVVFGLAILEAISYFLRVIWSFDFEFRPTIRDYDTFCSGWKHLLRGPVHYTHQFGDENHGYGSMK